MSGPTRAQAPRYNKVLMSLWYCWGLIQNETEFSLQHGHWWFSQPVTPSKLKWKPLNTGSLESDKWKKIYVQKASPRIRSVQYFICEIFGKNVLPKFIKLCMETPCLCPFQGHKLYGRRKPTETSVFEFSYLCVNSSLEELIKIKVIFILR